MLTCRVEDELWPGQIQQDYVRALLHPFEDDFTTVRGDVEVANVKVGREVGQLPLGARLEVDEPEILMLNVSSQEHERLSSREEGEMSSSSSEDQGRQRARRGLGGDGFHRKCGANIGSGVDKEAPVGSPRWIDRIFMDKGSRRAAIHGHAKEVWDAVIVGRRSDRLAVGGPGWSALQIERVSHHARVRAVGLHHV